MKRHGCKRPDLIKTPQLRRSESAMVSGRSARKDFECAREFPSSSRFSRCWWRVRRRPMAFSRMVATPTSRSTAPRRKSTSPPSSTPSIARCCAWRRVSGRATIMMPGSIRRFPRSRPARWNCSRRTCSTRWTFRPCRSGAASRPVSKPHSCCGKFSRPRMSTRTPPSASCATGCGSYRAPTYRSAPPARACAWAMWCSPPTWWRACPPSMTPSSARGKRKGSAHIAT